MKIRVTITLDPELHAHAKRVARARRTSVSGLFEEFLRTTPSLRGKKFLVDSLVGCVELRDSPPGKDPLHDALRAKYLDRRSPLA